MLSRKFFKRKYSERVKCKGNYSPFHCVFIFTEALGVTRKARVKKVGMLIKRRHYLRRYFTVRLDVELFSVTYHLFGLDKVLLYAAPNSTSNK